MYGERACARAQHSYTALPAYPAGFVSSFDYTTTHTPQQTHTHITHTCVHASTHACVCKETFSSGTGKTAAATKKRKYLPDPAQMHVPRLPAGFAPATVHKLVRPTRLLVRQACQAGQGPQSLGPSELRGVPAQKSFKTCGSTRSCSSTSTRSTTFTRIPSRFDTVFSLFPGADCTPQSGLHHK